jgi:hypothetical protein
VYQDILDWASASVVANRLLDVPRSFAGHTIKPFRKDAACPFCQLKAGERNTKK